MKKKIIIGSVAVLVCAIIGGGLWFVNYQAQEKIKEEQFLEDVAKAKEEALQKEEDKLLEQENLEVEGEEVTQEDESEDVTTEDTATNESSSREVTHNVTMSVLGYGDIKLELYGELAPASVDNFVKLASEGFYDGLIFHRVIEGFMIQGGDPQGTGMGGSDEQIFGEFAINGFDNDLSHERGVISMARSMDNDSASSQFFIVHQNSSFLDGSYAGFGMVTEGIEVIDEIASLGTDGNDKPFEDVVITSVTVD